MVGRVDLKQFENSERYNWEFKSCKAKKEFLQKKMKKLIKSLRGKWIILEDF